MGITGNLWPGMFFPDEYDESEISSSQSRVTTRTNWTKWYSSARLHCMMITWHWFDTKLKPDLKKRWLSDYESHGDQRVQQLELKRGITNEAMIVNREAERNSHSTKWEILYFWGLWTTSCCVEHPVGITAGKKDRVAQIPVAYPSCAPK